MLEAIQYCEYIAEKKLSWSYTDDNRAGDHIWWISDIQNFKNHYPKWNLKHTIQDVLKKKSFKIPVVGCKSFLNKRIFTYIA